MTAFTWVPDQGASRKVKSRVNKAQFGDGYAQTSADAINSIDETWTLSFTLRTRSEVMAIADFLSFRKGITFFQWTTPRGETQNFKCETWDESYNHDGDSAITATFERYFGL